MCEQSSCKCTPPKEDYSSVDYQLSILTAAKEGKPIEVANKVNEKSMGSWNQRDYDGSFNFVSFCYRIKREPRTFNLWVKDKACFYEVQGTTEQNRISYRKDGWEKIKAVEQLDA